MLPMVEQLDLPALENWTLINIVLLIRVVTYPTYGYTAASHLPVGINLKSTHA